MIKLRALNQDLILEESVVVTNYETVEIEFLGHETRGEVIVIFNNKIRQKLDSNIVVIPTIYLKEKTLSIKLITKHDGYMKSYSIDSLPLKRALLIGDGIDMLYPEKIKHLESRIAKLESDIIKKIEEYLKQ